tara:strand:- start:1388 stop:1870 length:483 start_codon:yes stop_codon:yes gene_type:complete
MPYTVEELKKKETYQKIADADKNELKKLFEDEEARAAISGSTDGSIQTLRNENGVILSYEDPENPGETYPSNIQLVRVPINYFATDEELVEVKLKKDRRFGDFRPNEPRDTGKSIDQLRTELQIELDTAVENNKIIVEKEKALDKAIEDLNAKIAELGSG